MIYNKKLTLKILSNAILLNKGNGKGQTNTSRI